MGLFQLTEDQQSLKEMLREFAEQEMAPKAEELDKTGRFPAETIEALTEMGIMALNIPEEYGGCGMDEVCKVIAIEELGRCCAGTTEIVSTQLLVNDIILNNGNEEQKQKYLGLAAEGRLGAFALTEPGAGSDAGSLRTRAVKDGDNYIINGAKCFISNMGPEEGDFAIVIALTDPEKKTRGGMTAFIVDRDNPGLSVGKTEDKMGMRAAAVSELVLTDCVVPASAILGKEGDGFKVAMAGLDGGRIAMAALSVGIAQGAMDAAAKYSTERVQFGKPICENQGLRWYVAEMATKIHAAHLLALEAADARDRKDPATGKLASMAKFYGSEIANEVVFKAVQMHGGYGFVTDYAVERMYRDARILTIFEGTSEIQKTVIAREVYKDYK